jgi:lipid II:glycine glycyltransferase (peptidoglycan interpeptide bridge formation enzyme)
MFLTKVVPADVPGRLSFFQGGFWALFKERVERGVMAFLVSGADGTVPLVAIERVGSGGVPYAYVPRGPAFNVEESGNGALLEELGELLRAYLPSGCAAVRFDTVFPSPYVGPEYYTEAGQWKGAPRPEMRELRMNYGTVRRLLRKSPRDHLCPDTVIVDLAAPEETILARMRQTTRNGIRRAERAGVTVRDRGPAWLGDWHRIYADTARRKGFFAEGLEYFSELFRAQEACPVAIAPELLVLSAERAGEPLAGAIVALHGECAYYLYAGSLDAGREHMPNYALQWEIIRRARAAGCRRYDLLGVPPNNDPYHSMYGLYTFKTGFGGRVVHWSGCWDYVLDPDAYARLVNAENLAV